MDFEAKNEAYVRAKKEMELDSKTLTNLEEEKKKLEKEKSKYQRALKKAEKANDASAKKNAENNLKDVEKKIEAKIAELEIVKERIRVAKSAIEQAIAEIQQHPDMKKAMDEALSKRYEKQLKKLQPERDKLNKQKEDEEVNKRGLEFLELLIKAEPSSSNLLADLLKAKEEMEKLNEELSTLDYRNPKDLPRIGEIAQKLIPDARNAIATSKKGLMDIIKKRGIQLFTEATLDEIVDKMIKNGLSKDSNGNIDVNQSLSDNIDMSDKQIKSLSKQIKSYDKQIGNYTILRGASYTSNTQQSQQQQQPQQQPTKWYHQLAKRFHEWREARKQKQLPVSQQPTESIDTRSMFSKELMRDAFREGIGESGKFDGTYEREALKKAKEARKQNQNQNQNGRGGSR